jgi:hypothetical protein
MGSWFRFRAPTLCIRLWLVSEPDVVVAVGQLIRGHSIPRRRFLRCGVERRCELLLCLKSRAESIEGVHLVIWTSKNSNGAVFDCNHGLRGSMSGVPTAGTGDAARWLMLEKLRRVDGGMPADAGELLEMVPTPDEWDREMVHEQKRKCVTPARGQRRLTGITPNR